MKRIWIMGRVRDLDLKDTKPFEDSVNDDLANFNGKNLKGVFNVELACAQKVHFKWKVSTPEPDTPCEMPEFVSWLITGECNEFQPAYGYMLPRFPGFEYSINTDDFAALYKRNSNYYKASKFKKANIMFSNFTGLMMSIDYYY